MDQDVPGVGRMIFYLWVVLYIYQWSFLIKKKYYATPRTLVYQT